MRFLVKPKITAIVFTMCGRQIGKIATRCDVQIGCGIDWDFTP